MIIPATTAYGAAGAQATQANATPEESPANQLGKDTFLQLMVAQLRNQDPMNPTDSAAFLAQTAQFTSLEKMTELADQSAAAVAAQMAFGASSLVGRTVTYTDSEGVESTGLVDSVRFAPEGPMLRIGEDQVPINAVVGVGATNSEPADTPDSSSDAAVDGSGAADSGGGAA